MYIISPRSADKPTELQRLMVLMLLPRRRKPALLTFTLKSLSHDPPEKGAAVVTERGHLVVVNAELVWDVDAEPLLCDLREEKDTSALKAMSFVMTGVAAWQ